MIPVNMLLRIINSCNHTIIIIIIIIIIINQNHIDLLSISYY